MLSVYLDGELPSPWKEKMESHVKDCPQCRQRLEMYRLVSGAAVRDETALMEAAKARVWRNLETGGRGSLRRSGLVNRGFSVWRRTISVPLPAAAAAAAVLVIACATLLVRRPAAPELLIPQMSFAPEESLEAPGIIPVADMNGVLQYLDSKDNGDVLILRLPESRSFTSSGEPVIVKAADYTRRQP
jgi:anti-sigma factor RsiW